MPVPHLNIRIVQRSRELPLPLEKIVFRVRPENKDQANYTEIMLPTNAPPEYADRATLWNSAEEVEKQWNSSLQNVLQNVPMKVQRKCKADDKETRFLKDEYGALMPCPVQHTAAKITMGKDCTIKSRTARMFT